MENKMRYKMKLIVLVCTALTATAPAFSQSADAADADADAAEDNGGAKTSWYNAWFNLNRQEHPWYFGIAGGNTRNTLYQGGAENYRPDETWEGDGGWTLSLVARYQIFNWLAVQAEPTYITKNYRWRGKDLLSSTNVKYHEYYWTTNGFIDLPLLVNLSSGWGSDASRIRVFANAGVFIGVWAHGNEHGKIQRIANTSPSYGTVEVLYPYDTDYEFDERRDNRFDGGLLFGGGLQYEVHAFSFIAEFRYSYSLSDLQKQYQSAGFSPQMNNTWIVQVGALFNPGIFFEGTKSSEE
jgi:hypothetical protein